MKLGRRELNVSAYSSEMLLNTVTRVLLVTLI